MMKNCFYNIEYKYSPWVFFYLKPHDKESSLKKGFLFA